MAFAAGTPDVVFGSDSLSRLPEKLDELGAARVMIVATPGRAALVGSIREMLGPRVVEVFARAVPHVPEDVAETAWNAARASRADCIVAPGGGSAIGVAKVVAMEIPIPIVAVPTTYSGSEMTPIWGLTRSGKKTTGRNPDILPRLVIYDPDLTLGLPLDTTASSGLNAIAHCIEALYARDDEVGRLAISGIRLLSESLPRLMVNPADASAREAALKGAWHAGLSLANAPMALHHKLCHTLGGLFDLPHAETHAVLLPYTTAFNRDAAPEAMAAAANALDGDDAALALLGLARITRAPLSLRELGLREEHIDRASRLATEQEYSNPRALTMQAIRELLLAALDGNAGYITPQDS